MAGIRRLTSSSRRRVFHKPQKFWRTAAEMIKAVAAKRGISLDTHQSLGDFVVRLEKEHPGLGLINDFSIVNHLHINLYQDQMPPEMVEKNAQTLKEFVAKLRSLLSLNVMQKGQ